MVVAIVMGGGPSVLVGATQLASGAAVLDVWAMERRTSGPRNQIVHASYGSMTTLCSNWPGPAPVDGQARGWSASINGSGPRR